MSDLTVKDKPAVPAANNAGRPAAPNQQVQNGQAPDEGDNFVAQQGAAENQEKEKGFNIFKAAWGFVKGFVKEALSIAFFIPKLLFNLVTDPVNTIKGFANGFLALGKLLFNPGELVKALGNAWEQFKAADSDQKGQVIGRILVNITTVPLAGNPLLLNARLVSSCKRFFVGRGAIAANADVLSRFQSITGSRWKTFLASRKIAKRANLERDFERALRLEGIPAELAPKLIITKKELPLTLLGGYVPSKHVIYINQVWLNILPTRLISFILPGMENRFGTLVRHEVKHAGQALLAARVGGEVPRIIATIFGPLPFIPQRVWDRAYQLSPLQPGTRLYNRAAQIPKQFEVSFQRTSGAATSGGSFWRNYRSQRAYLKDPLERETFRVQMRYTGLAPAIPTPSIHNLPRLAPLVEEANGNSTNTSNSGQQNGNRLDRAA